MSYKEYFILSVSELSGEIKRLNLRLIFIEAELKEAKKEFLNLTKLLGDDEEIYNTLYQVVNNKDKLILEREDIKDELKRLKRKLRNMRYYKKLKDEVQQKEIEELKDSFDI